MLQQVRDCLQGTQKHCKDRKVKICNDCFNKKWLPVAMPQMQDFPLGMLQQKD